jgi:hypothetical protein
MAHNAHMDRPRFQISVAGMLGLIACVAVNVWLFRVGILWGLLAINITKHVLIAYLCQILGVDRGSAQPASMTVAVPHSNAAVLAAAPRST